MLGARRAQPGRRGLPCSAYSASLEQRQTSRAPLSSNVPSVTGSMPPAWKRFAAKVTRAECAAAGPSVAR